MIKVKLFDFQKEAVDKLLDYALSHDTKNTITMKAPTGSGKTVMLIDYIDKFINHVGNEYAFVWLCPGKGDLEMQSYESMLNIAPGLKSGDLFDALNNGFEEGSTTFINWELITKKGNRAITDSEKKNLYDRIDEAKRNGIKFIVIIDEEHSNDTKKANDIINYFNPEHIIRVSATAKKNQKTEFFEIDEQDVINSGLITKAIYVNEGIEDDTEVDEDYKFLLPLADEKRKEMINSYKKLGVNVNPLVLIQFPNGKPEYIEAVEKQLETMDYTYNNGMVSKWMSGAHKDLPDNLTENNSTKAFLLMKQAISTGWDCPRAKILVKLRENMSEQFTIQTIGRIRRTPERKHYEDEVLDYSYVYTFDEEYKNGLIGELDRAYEPRRLFLKDKCKEITLEKENRDLDYEGLGSKEVCETIFEYLKDKYKLTDDYKKNEEILAGRGFVFGDEIDKQIGAGKVALTEDLEKGIEHKNIKVRMDTHLHGIMRLHNEDILKHILGMSNEEVRTILLRLFRNEKKKKFKILALKTKEYNAFIINNIDKLKEDFREVVAKKYSQKKLFTHIPNPKKSTFKIPEMDFYNYDVGVKDETLYEKNVYEGYTSGFVTSNVRSGPEMLFEEYCNNDTDIEWFYKNGDKGQNYFSIVYVDGVYNQHLFYPDYLVKDKEDNIWIIETKGGEKKGEDKNIDKQAKNKFKAFKNYANKHNIKWGFVRDKDNKLYINNTEYEEDMNSDNWEKIEKQLK
ncbi:MAG: DEAD/DEAH box helicase family protein [Eubacterium sp.]|nr:DEAD/DEAH box helicase family protein [Eubacterium sp.]